MTKKPGRKCVLVAINETAGTLRTFGQFPDLAAVGEELERLFNSDRWPDGWTPYLFESCGGAFGHPRWWTPNPEGGAGRRGVAPGRLRSLRGPSAQADVPDRPGRRHQRERAGV